MSEIKTSYFGNIKKLEAAGIKTISISRYPPKWYSGLQLQKLAPTGPMLKMKDAEYTLKFKEILSKLNPNEVKAELESMGNGKPVAMLCFERPQDFCHRHLVAAWLNESCGTNITEFGVEPTRQNSMNLNEVEDI